MEEKTKNILKWVSDRIKEPSTWHGLSILLVSVGVTVRPDLLQAIITLGAGISSIILIFTNESK